MRYMSRVEIRTKINNISIRKVIHDFVHVHTACYGFLRLTNSPCNKNYYYYCAELLAAMATYTFKLPKKHFIEEIGGNQKFLALQILADTKLELGDLYLVCSSNK